MFVDVIIPLRFRDSVTYSVPQELEDRIVPGSIVKVTVVGRSYTAVVLKVKEEPGFDPGKIKPVKEIVNFPPVTESNMEFLRQVASYYMCSLGETFRFAAPSTVKALKRNNGSTRAEEPANGGKDTVPDHVAALPVLSNAQEEAAGLIRDRFTEGRNVLLHGVTGSGKTEIYITLAAECFRKGRSVLYLVPEIALSRQIQNRLNTCFGDSLLVYHSKQTASHKREVYARIAENSSPVILLGLRSALFLPFRNLGLIMSTKNTIRPTNRRTRPHVTTAVTLP